MMQSGLLRVLTKKSSAPLGDTGQVPAVGDEPPTPVPAIATPPPTASALRPAKRRSPVIVGAAIVASLTLAADVAVVVVHRRAPVRVPAAASAPQPLLPTYMLLPPGTPPAVVQAAPEPAEPPAAPPVVAMAAPPPKPHSHGHHKHSRSSR
ncbi:MAG: hypothetical protein ACXVDD_02655 [Polyangia bacterium]